MMKTCCMLLLAGVASMLNAGEPPPGKVELKITIPRPVMSCCLFRFPKDLNLEKPRKGKRPPFYVPKGTRLLSHEKPVSSSDPAPIIGDLELVTDGDKEGHDGCFVELEPGVQWVQIDLGAAYDVHAIVIWHYHSQIRVYHDVIIKASDDRNFTSNVTTVFNNDHDNSAGQGAGKDKQYIETNEGRLVDAKGVNTRYLRFYSNGSTSSESNHYIEIEVYGTPQK